MKLNIQDPEEMVKISQELADDSQKFIGKTYVRKGKVIIFENINGVITDIIPKKNGRVDVILDHNYDEPIIFDTTKKNWNIQEYIGEQECSIK